MVALELEAAQCPICRARTGEPVAVGEDFEYRTSDDSFLARRCPRCTSVYLDPRPAQSELPTIYPPTYHAFEFDAEHYGIVHTVRSRLEARRLLRTFGDLPSDARLLDVGCGDGFHLDLLRRHGPRGWTLEGVDLDERAVAAARQRGLTVHHGAIEGVALPERGYDGAILIQTIEHVPDPLRLLSEIHRVVKPGGRLLLVTDNTDSWDFRLFGSRHWGGYHFPRHLNLFNPDAVRQLAERSGWEVDDLRTMVSPVNWTYSVRNVLDDHGAPTRVVRRFALDQPVSLAVFTAWDAIMTALGRGALVRAELVRAAT